MQKVIRLLKARSASKDEWIRNHADIRSHAYEDSWIAAVSLKKLRKVKGFNCGKLSYLKLIVGKLFLETMYFLEIIQT